MMLLLGRNLHLTITSSLLLFCLLLVVVYEGTTTAATEWEAQSNNSTLMLSNSSKFVQRWWHHPGRGGCRRQPWVCRKGEQRPHRMRCCNNRCVDISSDVDHCGSCHRRCRYTWLCCRGHCRNINRNRRHCGRCFNRCPIHVRCRYGMCGYGQHYRPPKPLPPTRLQSPDPPSFDLIR